jgi:hypothetical protein
VTYFKDYVDARIMVDFYDDRIRGGPMKKNHRAILCILACERYVVERRFGHGAGLTP